MPSSDPFLICLFCLLIGLLNLGLGGSDRLVPRWDMRTGEELPNEKESVML